MNKLTTEFRLPSGVKVEAFQLYGEHYDILTSGEYRESERMLEFICALLVSVGDKVFVHNKANHKDNLEFVKQLRATDKEHILCTVRQASMDFEKDFIFTHKWLDKDGTNRSKEIKVTLNDVENPTTLEYIETLVSKFGESERDFLTELNKDGTFTTTPSLNRGATYAELATTYELSLPKSKHTVQLSYLSGWGEQYIASKKNPTPNDVIEARQPRYKSEKGTWVQLKIRNLPMKDIEFLRTQIKAHEGKVDMVIDFENPANSSEIISQSLIGQTAFFFPSEAL